MIKNSTISLIDTDIEQQDIDHIEHNITELSYNAKFVSFKHRGKIESLRFFIV